MVRTRSVSRRTVSTLNTFPLTVVISYLPLALRVRLGQVNRQLHEAAASFSLKDFHVILRYFGCDDDSTPCLRCGLLDRPPFQHPVLILDNPESIRDVERALSQVG
jgi:hypothetical protein